MTDRIYTIGYTGRKPADIKRLAEELDATVFDVRFAPRSRVPHWNAGNLAKLLGDRYKHIWAFGNRNYRGGPVDLVDFSAGLEEVRQSPRPVILMCACKDPATCHRTAIAGKLQEAGMEVTELGDFSKQLRLL